MLTTPVLIAINCVVYFLEYYVYNNDVFGMYFGLNELFFLGAYWQLLTTMFLHGSLMHLLMNMAVLYQFGTILERYLGSFKFMLLYIGGGIVTSLLSLSYLAFANVNLVGASGAICVLLGFMANLDRYNRKRTLHRSDFDEFRSAFTRCKYSLVCAYIWIWYRLSVWIFKGF